MESEPNDVPAERWRQVERVYLAVLERPQAERAAALDALCAGESAVRRDVEALLEQQPAADSFLATGAMAYAAQMLSDAPHADLIDHTIGHYRITGRLGVGGMGEVYRARDTRLGRDVALKILPRAFTRDPDRLARFEREARVLASLSHPTIATIHGLEESGGVPALVLELVDGETLAERVARGPLPQQEALAIARQLADALHAAHEKGIVHRDLKPANIKLTPDGRVKVLDFGLAKLIADGAAAGDVAHVPTLTVNVTRAGMLLGTAAYMSPEQARGLPVDEQTDIWALGCVMFEMLSGQQAFGGASAGDAIAAVLEREPDWRALPAGTSDGVRRLLERCLRKDRARRLRDVHDVRLDLDEPGQPLRAEAAPTRRGRSRWTAALASVGIAGLALVILMSRRDEAVERPIRFELTFEGYSVAATPLPSPDGSHLVAAVTDPDGQRLLWLRRLEEPHGRVLAGTDGAAAVFWFPDGEWIGFASNGRLRRISSRGGSPQTLGDFPDAFAVTVNRAGEFVFAPSNRSGLFRMRPGTAPEPLTTLDASFMENSHRHPHFLPDGDRFVFTARSAAADLNAVYVGSLRTGQVRRLLPVGSQVVYVEDRDEVSGALLYVREGTLFRHPFDGQQFTGDPHPLVDGVQHNTIAATAGFAASRQGNLLITRIGEAVMLPSWFTRDGRTDGVLPPGFYYSLRISPDGGRALFNRADDAYGNRDTWTIDLRTGSLKRLTNNRANDLQAVWSPDSTRIAFASDREGAPALRVYVKEAVDAGADERPIPNFPDGNFSLMDWSRDGRWLALQGRAAPYDDIVIVPLTGQAAFPLATTPFAEDLPRFSPDGRWVAFSSAVAGRSEVYVRPFTPQSQTAMIPVSTAGGEYPVWSHDGRELYFLTPDSTVYAVKASTLARGEPVAQPLFRACSEEHPVYGQSAPPYDSAPDGRFLMLCRGPEPGFTVTAGPSATAPSLVR